MITKKLDNNKINTNIKPPSPKIIPQKIENNEEDEDDIFGTKNKKIQNEENDDDDIFSIPKKNKVESNNYYDNDDIFGSNNYKNIKNNDDDNLFG